MDKLYINPDTVSIVSLVGDEGKVYLEFRKFVPDIPLTYSPGGTAPSKLASIVGVFIDKNIAQTLIETLSDIGSGENEPDQR